MEEETGRWAKRTRHGDFMIATIQHQDKQYPAFQATGNAARFVRAFAMEVCKGTGVDIGCHKPEWCFPDAAPIDPVLNGLTATDFPFEDLDYIHSSHCLEHVPDWVEALDYWYLKLRQGGTLFLYLPHPDQSYWQPWHNRKHIHQLTPIMIERYLYDRGWKNIFVSQRDLNHSFVAIAEKQ